MLWKRHHILELPALPRQRDELLVALREARARRRRQLAMRFASALAFGGGLAVIVTTYM